jgi:hypothetical protein
LRTRAPVLSERDAASGHAKLAAKASRVNEEILMFLIRKSDDQKRCLL